MSFGLLAPLALGLLALLAGPVIAHLARQRPQQTVDYGAMLLLRRLQRKLRRQRRLHDPLLMLLRLLAIALVVAAASRPEARWPGGAPEVGGTGAVVVVIDNSLSMDLGGDGVQLVSADAAGAADGSLLSVARERAAALIRELPEGTLVGAVTIGGEAERVTPQLSPERERVAVLVEQIAQTQGATDLVGGLRHARRLLGGQGGEVVVFTDEAGPTAVPAAREEIRLLGDQGGAIVPRPIRPTAPANVSVVAATYGDGPEGGTVTLSVANYGPEPVEAPCVVELPDGAEITAFVEVAAGEVAESRVTVPRVAEGGVALARIETDALDGGAGDVAADNAFAFHLPRVGASRVLVVDGDPGLTPIASEVYFLERALAPWGMSAADRGGVLPDVTAMAGVGELDPKVHRVVFLANVPDPGPLANRLTEFVRAGGGLVIGLGDNVTADRYNGALAGLLPSPLRRARALADPDEFGVPTDLPDTALDLFEPFSRGGRSGYANVRWHTLFTLEPYQDTVVPEGEPAPDGAVRTLLRLDGELPLLVERTVGRGRVLVFTGTFDMGWGNLPLQAVYMPFVQRLVTYLGGEAGGGGERRTAQVGQTLSIDLPDTALDVSVTGPQGSVAAHVDGGRVTFTPEQAGAFLVETPGAPPLAWVAVNVDPTESDVRTGPELIRTAAEVDPERYLQRLALGPWLLLLGLGFVLVGAVWSAVLGRRRAIGPEQNDDLEPSLEAHDAA